MAGNLFETFVVSEIIKSFLNAGKTQLPLYYYRDRDGREIDLVIEEADKLYPVEIKRKIRLREDLWALPVAYL